MQLELQQGVDIAGNLIGGLLTLHVVGNGDRELEGCCERYWASNRLEQWQGFGAQDLVNESLHKAEAVGRGRARQVQVLLDHQCEQLSGSRHPVEKKMSSAPDSVA